MRLNLPYFMADDSVEFVIKAVKMVAEHGWELLPQVIRYRKIPKISPGADIFQRSF